ncbi:hypothetical protein BAUCODRAFT_77716 [Baudoinia panamericana UAMH 10762]|uniref:Aminotransferase class I/classII large domain-containing protein n=1 Tax=Baudoinia panamericana (strain UAMH 10762) TaxID=717646 RepID=M2M7U3_BAUPA|nr:uncharacterized protein BAUCODRAFT_77716 [Baudoinia panamericana UAMH 10762]EMC92401.1 hypothetical protein BAUCODRAFT_77716 [Baudoinia panamericana UAMH 10762]
MRGWPNPALFPKQALQDAANAALSDPTTSSEALEYGPDPGWEPCRKAVANWLTEFYRPADHEGESYSSDVARLCITGGASQNLGCMLSVYTDPEYTRNIWIVAPAYFLAFRIFEDAGFAGKMRAVPEDEDGVDLTYLRRELEESEQKAKAEGKDRPRYKLARRRAKVYKHIIYCVPTFANPSSRTMSLQHRTEMVRIARDYDALLVADDVYDFLQWPAAERSGRSLDDMERAHLPRLTDIDRVIDGGSDRNGADGFGNACSNGSFSKIVAPGVRVGWVEGTPKFAYGVSQCGTTRSGGAPSQLTSTYMTHLLTSGALPKHIRHTLQPAYARRYASLMRAIETHLVPLGFTLPQPNREVVGGYFVWLALPEGSKWNADKLAARCRTEENVIVAPGGLFEVPGDGERVSFEGHIRLCFAWEDERSLVDGVKRVGRVAARIRDEDAGDQGSQGFDADSFK